MAFIDSGKTFDKDENHTKMKKRMENMDTAQYPLRIPAALYKQVKLKLIKEDKNLRELLLDILNEYVKE